MRRPRLRPAALGLGALAGYVLGVFALGAALAYPLDQALRALGLFDGEFHRLTYRLLEALALLGLVPLLRCLGARGRAAWGYGRGRGLAPAWRELAIGLVVGLATIGLVVVALLALEVRAMRAEPPPLIVLAAKAVIVAAIVAVLEESWFRGALHTAIERIGGAAVAVGATAALYAVLHFYRPAALDSGTAPGWASGARSVIGGFAGLADPDVVGPLLALAAAGALLGALRVRTGRIAAAIGMHAGWVLVIRVGRPATEPRFDSELAWLAAGYDGIVGWLALAAFALVAVLAFPPGRRVRA